MSIVRYVNKKTGRVAVYESTSHYDPETKQSRPIRKYLGTEDPETGKLIPSSGKRGRKKESDDNSSHSKKEKPETDYRLPASCRDTEKRMYGKRRQDQSFRTPQPVAVFKPGTYQRSRFPYTGSVDRISIGGSHGPSVFKIHHTPIPE